jgi:hypothetical protein
MGMTKRKKKRVAPFAHRKPQCGEHGKMETLNTYIGSLD